MKPHWRTLLTTGLAWLAGAIAAAGSSPLLPGWPPREPERQALRLLAAGVFAGASLCAARIASSRRAGVLEVAGVLAFAAFPLMLVEALSRHPDVAIPEDRAEFRWLYHRFELHIGFVMAEATALACLVAGAVGLLRDAVRWPLAVYLGGLSCLAGLVLGAVCFPDEGWMLGGPLGLAAVVFPATAASVRGPRAVAGRGARCLAVLAVAMGAVLASDLSWNHWALRHEGGPWPYYSLWPFAEQASHASRVLLVQLGGCGVALIFAVLSGRGGDRSMLSTSGVPVLLVALVCLVGGTARLQQQRVEVLNWQWSDAREVAGSRSLCSCEDRWKRVPRLGRPIPITPLPWPFQGRIGHAFQRSVVRIDVDLTDPVMDRVPGELDRLRALPEVRIDGSRHPEKSTALEQRIEAEDDISYGEFIRGLDRGVDVHDTHMHLILDNGPATP